MEAQPWLEWLGGLPHAALLRRSVTTYILVSAAHILGIGLLVGAILPLDLRLMGLLRRGALGELVPFFTRVAAAGLTLAIVTGLMLFSVKPVEYAGNPAFLIKLGLLALGLVNIAIQHAARGWATVGDGAKPSPVTRMLAGLSFAIWVSTLVAGRWIGFV